MVRDTTEEGMLTEQYSGPAVKNSMTGAQLVAYVEHPLSGDICPEVDLVTGLHCHA